MNDTLSIRPMLASDKPAIWSILKPIVRSGLYYHGFSSDISEQEMGAFWFLPSHEHFVAELGGKIAGTYFLRPDPGGDHYVANCAYGTAKGFEGRGVGQAMCEHSLMVARERGYRAMQFNQVVSTNTRAVALWQRNGFQVIGCAPEPFLHPSLGPTEMHVMYREL